MTATATIIPDLRQYRWILISTSGGKDSEIAAAETVRMAKLQGVPMDRLVTVHSDLGDEDEWPGTGTLAAEQSRLLGITRHEVVFRTVAGDDGAKVQQSLIAHIEARGMWPDNARRYCTSDMKRGPILVLMTRLAREAREQGWAGPVPILNVMGLRAEESPARNKLAAFGRDERVSTKTTRTVDTWLPVHSWTTTEIWAEIKRLGLPYHWVYDAGMPRLSCRFCVLASKTALIRAAQLDPEGAWKRAFLEDKMGHTFRQGLSMLDIIAAAEQAGPVAVTGTQGCTAVEDWAA
jgi:3'-phosphoadenosine 5'-phosphosulfate sulfotransferase (PAPS reductase)/FAD synthetase